MTFRQRCEGIYKGVCLTRPFLPLLITAYFLIITCYFITWPIVGYDTDLWYHLSGGRYFWQNGAIAGDAFFSYISPPKSWYDYYWLFQAVVYKCHAWAGYQGLVILRCVLFVLTSLLICLFLFDSRQDSRRQVVGLFFITAYPVAVVFRELLVRPHLFSYLFIVVFLYILEIKREKISGIFKYTVALSAKKNKNIDLLEDAIVDSVYKAEVFRPEYSMVSNLRHITVLLSAQKLIAEALNSLDNKLPPEFISQDIKDALSFIDDILGKRFTEDLLDKIFSDFCIGK